MIKVNDDYSFDKAEHCWQLHHTRDGFHPKTKEPTRHTVTTYHGTVLQVCKAILDDNAGMAESLDELITIIKTTEKNLEEVINASQIIVRENNTNTTDPE